MHLPVRQREQPAGAVMRVLGQMTRGEIGFEVLPSRAGSR